MDGLNVKQKQLENEILDSLAKEFNIERNKLSLESSFLEDIGADSLDLVKLMMDLEDKYRVQISDEEAEKMRTVKDLVNYLVENLPGYKSGK